MDKVLVQLDVELGGCWLPIRDVVRLGRGAEIALEGRERGAVTLRANRVAVAEGILEPDSSGRLTLRITRLISRRAGDSALAA